VELTLSIAELTAVLNDLYHQGYPCFSLRYPLLDLDLATFDLDAADTVVRLTDRAEYQRRFEDLRSWFQEHDERYAIREIPDYTAYKTSLLQAGLIGYQNLDKVKTELLGTLTRNVLKGHPAAFVALDTNILRDRFFSTFVAQEAELKRKPLSFALTDIIRDELAFTYKYNERDLSGLLSHPNLTHHRHLVEQFWNQNKLKDRLQRLGHLEFIKIQSSMNFHLCGPTQGMDPAASADMRIIQSYQNFATTYRHVLLLSRDFDFIAISEGRPGIEPLMAELPRDVLPRGTIGWESLGELIYIWAVVFGCVELVAADNRVLRFFGLWKGKEPTHWNEELVGLEIDGLNLSAALRDIHICRRLGAIGGL